MPRCVRTRRTHTLAHCFRGASSETVTEFAKTPRRCHDPLDALGLSALTSAHVPGPGHRGLV
jgi:hypothetical protein